MAEIEQTYTIERPRMDVFKAIIDFENAADWQPNLREISVMEGKPLRPGTMIAQKKRMLFRTAFINADVTDYQPNKKIEFKGMLAGFPFVRVISVESSGAETQVRDNIVFKMGCLYFWYSPLLTMTLRTQMNSEWANLKNLLESRQR